MKQIITVGLILSFSASITNAQSLTEKLDLIFKSAYESSKSGAAILVSTGGKTIYQNQIGLANVEYQIPISAKTKFHIGSITKQFTAAAILMLQEEGKLNIADPISKHLAFMPSDKSAVTITQLLTHTSGIKDYPQIPEIRKQLRNNLSPTQLVNLVNKEDLEFVPGSELRYSNSGYLLLGLLIEKVSGEDYGSFLANRIFEVLDMNSTEVNSYEAIVPERATGYSEDENDELIHATFHSSPYAAGAIISTVEDLNKWVSGLRSGEIIGVKSLERMFANNLLTNGQATNLGFGWEINELAGSTCYEHSGFVPGYKANSIFIPEHETYVVIMQNNEYDSPTPTMLNAAALAIGMPYPSPKETKQLSDTATNNLTGSYALESGKQRIIYKNEQGMYIKAPGGQASKLYVFDKNTLYYKEGYRQLHFTKTSEGKTVGFTYVNRRLKSSATKISDSIPDEKNAVSLDLETMERYVGSYQFEPFKLAITLEQGTLHIQPEGSNKLPLTAISNSAFVVEEIGAEISFTTLANRNIEAALLLEGDIYKGLREQQ